MRCTISLVLFLGFTASCASDTRYFPVRDAAPRQNSLGFSISPPHGKNWYEKHKGDSLYYLKRTEGGNYSFFMKATEIRLTAKELSGQDFFEYVRGKKDLRLSETRYKNPSFAVIPVSSQSTHCARYLYTYEDHGNSTVKPDGFVKVENGGLFCMHPDTPGVGVDMYYVERMLAKSGQVSYRKEGQVFLDSLRFQSTN